MDMRGVLVVLVGEKRARKLDAFGMDFRAWRARVERRFAIHPGPPQVVEIVKQELEKDPAWQKLLDDENEEMLHL